MWHFRTLSVSLGFIDTYRGIPLDKDHARCQRSVRNLTRDQKQISQMKKALRFLSIRSPNPKFLATKSYRTWHNFHVKFSQNSHFSQRYAGNCWFTGWKTWKFRNLTYMNSILILLFKWTFCKWKPQIYILTKSNLLWSPTKIHSNICNHFRSKLLHSSLRKRHLVNQMGSNLVEVNFWSCLRNEPL